MELKVVYQMFTDIWRLYRKYANPVDSDEYINGMVSDATEIDNRYESGMCKKIILVVLDELNEVWLKKYGRK